jgi:RNA polymerase sigma-70 factor (ECF subfamily)
MELSHRLADDLDGCFADLVEEHQDLVFGVALRAVGNRADAEDVAQESFVRAYRALRKYPAARVKKMLLRPWLARIALNVARNHFRARRPVTELDAAADVRAPAAHEPVVLAERRDDRRMWIRLMAGLPERQRLAVGLRHVEGLSYPELAHALGRPLGSVKSDVHRGIRLLRAAFEAEQRSIEKVENREAV